jgi:hypothetical protein
MKFGTLDEYNQHSKEIHPKKIVRMQTLSGVRIIHRDPGGVIGKVVRCTICGKLVLAQERSLTAHSVRHAVSEEEEPLECPVCSAVSSDLTAYVLHTQIHRDPLALGSEETETVTVKLPFRFKCKICNLRFLEKTHLLVHVRTHRAGMFVETNIKGNILLKLHGV